MRDRQPAAIRPETRCWEVLKPHARGCERIACVRGQRIAVKNAAPLDPPFRRVPRHDDGSTGATWNPDDEWWDGRSAVPPGEVAYAVSFMSSRAALELGLEMNWTSKATKSVVNTRSPFLV